MSADIKALEERCVMRFEARGDMYQCDADGEWVRYRDHSNALASAIAERDEARAEAEHEKAVAMLVCEDALGLKARAEAAEARIEELTRERDAAITRCGEWAADFARKCACLEEAKAVLGRITEHRMQDDTVLEAVRGLSIVQEMARAFLHQGGSDAR